MNDYSISSISKRLHLRLQEYIESRYPISEESLLLERRKLLESPGVISTEPYIEATPVYEPGQSYDDYNIPNHCIKAMNTFSKYNPSVGVFPTPYIHQKEAMEAFISNENDLVISTGTGSGKTESFLHPILNSLIDEGATRNDQFKKNAVRALILYPMNALVSDQITRLRKLFGDKRVAEYFQNNYGRHPLFGMYTSRTPYPGERNEKKDKYQLKEIIEYYHSMEENNPNLANELKKRGKWVAKDLNQFKSGVRGDWKSKYLTKEMDRELFTRHEMQRTPPDILVTNYSMLEYMLMRPIERNIWEQTKEWLAEDEENKFVLVLDEAHMYRGASGAEVALLIRRLQARLGIDRDRLHCIMTSASLGEENDLSPVFDFAHQLTGKPNKRSFSMVTGTNEKRMPANTGDTSDAILFSNINNDLFNNRINEYNRVKENLNSVFPKLGWGGIPKQLEKLPQYLYECLEGYGPLEMIIASISGNAQKFKDIARNVFPEASEKVSQIATSNLLMLANAAKKNGRVLLPVRIHLFFKGISGIFVCTNPYCNVKESNGEKAFLGKMYDSSKLKCSCAEEARVYELLTHRKCGSSYIRGYVSKHEEERSFLWAEKGSGIVGNELIEAHFLVETPHASFEEYEPVWLDIKTGSLANTPPVNFNGYIQLYKPMNKKSTKRKKQKSNVITFNNCPCCLRKINGTISDLKTKGEQPFSNIVREQFVLQQPTNTDEFLPNEGRKVLLFSDGRQKAARLARDIPHEVELDSFRQAIIVAANNLEKTDEEAKLSGSLYSATLEVMYKNKLYFFEKNDRTKLMNHVNIFNERFDEDYEELITDGDVEIFDRFRVELLRQICHPLYSVYSTATGYVTARNKEMKRIKKAMGSDISSEDKEIIIELFIQELLEKVAVDTEINEYERYKIRGYNVDEWGVRKDTITKHLKKILDLFVKDEQEKIINALFLLCNEHKGMYFLAPKKLKLISGININWYKCNQCKSINMVCAKRKCVNCFSDNIQILDKNSEVLESEKGFWRSPIRDVIEKGFKITNLTVEEHTAQLSQKDPKIAIATTEEYELRFQDIVLDELEGAVDVLSCTTTMEVGVDIGSLTAVGLRNVPPQRENYQQRAGRAGRRGSALSTVLTYSQGGPHDHHYFKHPKAIISGPARKPIVYIENKKIVKRHLFAFLIQTYFHENAQIANESSGLLNSSLGDTKLFFEGPAPFNIESFELWLNHHLDTDFNQYPVIFDIIPEEVLQKELSIKSVDSQHKLNLIRQLSSGLIFELNSIYHGIKGSLSSNLDDEFEFDSNNKLLDLLFNHGILPTYAFPKDLSSLYIEEWDKNARKVIVKQRPQLEVNRALSEYAPGKQIVIDKRTYRIGGLFVPNPKNYEKPARDLGIPSLKKVTYCDACLFVSLDDLPTLICPVCNEKLNQTPFLRPTGFSPEGGSEVKDGDRDQEFTFAIPPQLPMPVNEEEPEEIYSPRLSYTNALDKKLIVMNKGAEDKNGFEVCVDCGAIWPVGEKESGNHSVPYKLKKQFGQTSYNCRGELRRVFLGNVFNSDLLLLRLKVGEEIDFNPGNQWVHDALKTIGETLVLAASRVLDIDYNELSAGYRLLPITENGADIYLFDTLSGGAGYAHAAGNDLNAIIDQTFEILQSCENNCETSCYKCLRHYSNQFFHKNLNRHVALELLNYIVYGTIEMLSIQDQKNILSPVKRMFEIHDETYKTLEKNGQYLLLLQSGRVIAAKNNIEWHTGQLDGSSIEYVSRYEVLHDLPNVYLGNNKKARALI